jgi:hypothetical protein
VVGEAERFILIDGYKRVRALKRLAHDTVRASGCKCRKSRRCCSSGGCAASANSVRAGTLGAHAAMKYLVPLARANAAAATQLATAVTPLKPTRSISPAARAPVAAVRIAGNMPFVLRIRFYAALG